MHTDVKQTYAMVATSEEFRLITLSLAGKLTDTDDIKAAKELNSRLCLQRVCSLKDQLGVAEQASRLAQKESEVA